MVVKQVKDQQAEGCPPSKRKCAPSSLLKLTSLSCRSPARLLANGWSESRHLDGTSQSANTSQAPATKLVLSCSNRFLGSFDVPTYSLSMTALFNDWIKGNLTDLRNVVIVSPDACGAKL